jgi:opacity protein-like surface antigen
MKMLISAIALAFALPAAAQAAPAVQSQQQPSQQQGTAGHAEHSNHAGHQMPKGSQQDEHKGHAMGGCCADKNGNGRMDCCEKMAADKGPAPQAKPGQTTPHQNH